LLIPPKEFIRLVYRFVAETPPETTLAPHVHLPRTQVPGSAAAGDFAPVNVRGGSTKLPPTDPSEPSSDLSKEDSTANQ